jgi:uncharacterized membrane protein
MVMDPPDSEIEKRQLDRLVFFNDAVFAIAITLLVLDLKLPPESGGVIRFWPLAPKLFGFLLSFAVIGAYWLFHHVLFGRVVREDMTLKVANLLFLITVVFLPFPTSIVAEFPVTRDGVVLYALSVAAVGFSAGLLSLVASRSQIAGSRANRDAILVFTVRSVATPLVFGLSALIAWGRPGLAMDLWWLVGPVSWLLSMASRRMRGRVRGRKVSDPAKRP